MTDWKGSEAYRGPHVILDRKEIAYVYKYTRTLKDETAQQLNAKLEAALQAHAKFTKPHE